MMCSKFLQLSHNNNGDNGFIAYIDRQFENYAIIINESCMIRLDFLPVTGVFAIIILLSIYFLFVTSKSELAPQEDQGIIISQLTAATKCFTAANTTLFTEVAKVYESFPETETIFELDGSS